MFKFIACRLIVNQNGFDFKESVTCSDSKILEFLNFYEKHVYEYVKQQGDGFFFKYLQGKLPKSLPESSLINYFGERSDYNVFF